MEDKEASCAHVLDVLLLPSSAERGYRMGMAIKTGRWTRADLSRLPDDGNRYEVLDGELFVTPQAASRHQYIAYELGSALGSYCRQHAIGWVAGSGAIIFEQENELQPDLQVVPGAYPSPDNVEWTAFSRSLLVVEILSDSTARRDLGKKRDAYLRIGIPSYWVVDADERRVLTWTGSPAAETPVVVTDVLRWQPRADLSPLEIPLDSIFPPLR